jgi:hypothetical protein
MLVDLAVEDSAKQADRLVGIVDGQGDPLALCTSIKAGCLPFSSSQAGIDAGASG